MGTLFFIACFNISCSSSFVFRNNPERYFISWRDYRIGVDLQYCLLKFADKVAPFTKHTAFAFWQLRAALILRRRDTCLRGCVLVCRKGGWGHRQLFCLNYPFYTKLASHFFFNCSSQRVILTGSVALTLEHTWLLNLSLLFNKYPWQKNKIFCFEGTFHFCFS